MLPILVNDQKTSLPFLKVQRVQSQRSRIESTDRCWGKRHNGHLLTVSSMSKKRKCFLRETDPPIVCPRATKVIPSSFIIPACENTPKVWSILDSVLQKANGTGPVASTHPPRKGTCGPTQAPTAMTMPSATRSATVDQKSVKAICSGQRFSSVKARWNILETTSLTKKPKKNIESGIMGPAFVPRSTSNPMDASFGPVPLWTLAVLKSSGMLLLHVYSISVQPRYYLSNH